MATNVFSSAGQEEWLPINENFKCKNCKVCLGKGCIGELPGMGGVFNSEIFIKNCLAWKEFYKSCSKSVRAKIDSQKILPKHIAIAPVTGAVQNIGFKNEKDFYFPYFLAAKNASIEICVGDGFPDEKLDFGINAVESLETKAYFFLKPYPNEILFNRIEKVRKNALAIGMDIDAFNIVTMRNQVNLEKKQVCQIEEFSKKSGLPLALKGIFTEEDVILCEKIHPQIAVVSNHGGRIETRIESSMSFLRKYAARLHACCKEVWVDGGIRDFLDVKVALFLGADKILIARPFIQSLCFGGTKKMQQKIKMFFEK